MSKTTPTLRTRPPTGEVPYPLILIEGPPKVGKTHTATALSKDPRIGRTLFFDLGEGSADEYGPVGDYEVVEHNGTYEDFLAQLEAAIALPHDPGRPNLIIIDSISELWEMLVEEVNNIALSQGKKKRDGSANVGVNLWVLAASKWHKVLKPLMKYDGLVVLTGRGKEVVEMDGNAPSGRTKWKVGGHKSLEGSVTVWIRMPEFRTAELIAARGQAVPVPDPGETLPLGTDLDLADFIFERMGCDPESTAARKLAAATADTVLVDAAKKALHAALGKDLEMTKAVWVEHLGDDFDAPAVSREQLDEMVADGKARLAETVEDAEEQDAEVAA